MKKRRGKEKNESCQESFSEWSSIHSSPSGRKGVFETDRDCRSSFSVFDTKVFVVRFECLQWKERMEMKKRQVVYQGILHSLAGGRVSFSRKEKTQEKNMCAEKGSQGKRGRGKEVLILPPTDTTIDQASFHDHLTVFIISRLICNRDLLFLSLLRFSSLILSLTLDHKTFLSVFCFLCQRIPIIIMMMMIRSQRELDDTSLLCWSPLSSLSFFIVREVIKTGDVRNEMVYVPWILGLVSVCMTIIFMMMLMMILHSSDSLNDVSLFLEREWSSFLPCCCLSSKKRNSSIY